MEKRGVIDPEFTPSQSGTEKRSDDSTDKKAVVERLAADDVVARLSKQVVKAVKK